MYHEEIVKHFLIVSVVWLATKIPTQSTGTAKEKEKKKKKCLKLNNAVNAIDTEYFIPNVYAHAHAHSLA